LTLLSTAPYNASANYARGIVAMQTRSLIHQLQASLQQAFAIKPDGLPLNSDDQALLEKVATAIVDRHMAEPAILFLESAGPMNFLSSQALHFLAPILDMACDAHDIQQVATLLERRDAIPCLIERIGARSAAAGAPVR